MPRISKPCLCGSGNERYELRDAAGIFCTFVCEKCESDERKKFNPAIFESGTQYSATGDEEMIGHEADVDDY